MKLAQICLEAFSSPSLRHLLQSAVMKHIFIYWGLVNKQNFRYWSQNNPHELHQRPLHSPKVTVWCAMGSFGVWGPYFFEEKGATVTVTSDRYCEMLERFLRPKVAQLLADYEADDVWFQQDGATSHTSRRSLGILQDMFPSQVISLRGDIGWPPRSPDLNPCDFFYAVM